MPILYEGFGHQNIVNVGSGFIDKWSVGKDQKLIISSEDIENYCSTDTYLTKLETTGGANALSMLFTKDVDEDNSFKIQVLTNSLVRKIPQTSSLTITYSPNIDVNGNAVNVTTRFVGDTFDVERTFNFTGIFYKWALNNYHAAYDLSLESKTDFATLFSIFDKNSFGSKYIIARDSLLYLARHNNYQSENLSIFIHINDLADFKSVVQDLLNNGFVINYITKNNNNEICTISVKTNNIRITTKICYEEPTYYRHYGHDGLKTEVEFRMNKDYLYNKKSVNFKGFTISIPKNHIQYLIDNYGESWETPDKEWHHLHSNLTKVSSVSFTGTNISNAIINDIARKDSIGI